MIFLGQIVIDFVIVRFISDEDVFNQCDVGGRIEGSGRNGGPVLVVRPPKQVPAADTAKSPFSGFRRLVPDETFGRRQREISVRHAGHGGVVPAGSPALRAVAGYGSANRSA